MRHTIILWRGFVGLAVLALATAWIFVFDSAISGSPTGNEAAAAELTWGHLSSANGDLPVPSGSTQQVLTLILDVDKDGINDFVIGARRQPGPSLVWYRRGTDGWTRHVIETDALNMEAGGAFHDIDNDGDLDVVAGNDNKDNEIWWWENPYPDFAPDTDWTRREIKNSGAKKHHDMMFGNFDDDPGTEFVFWNQGAKTLSIVDIPADPRATQPWPDAAVIFTAPNGKYEGMTQADVDGDGKADVVAGGYWFKHTGGTNFTSYLIESGIYMRVAAAQLIPGGRPEIVQVPGDSDGPGRWFVWDGAGWVGHDLPVGEIRHGHSLGIADVNADGHLDIFLGEMRFEAGAANENPDARTMFLLGDGQGNFTVEQVAAGFGQHESRPADLDGDGDIDILGKPFTWDTPRLDIWLNGASTPACTTPLAHWSSHIIDNARPYRAVFIDSADLDGDGFDDIITGAWWYRNPGVPGGTWQRYEIGAPLNQMALIADFDNDSDADILGTKWDGGNPDQMQKGSEFVWAQNDGAGNFVIHENIQPGDGDFLQGAVIDSFAPGSREVMLSWHNGTDALESLSVPADPATEQWTIQQATSLSQSEDLSTGDIDRDGDADLLLGTIWLENEAGAWSDHSLFTTGDKPDRNRLADMNGDGRLDAVVGYETDNQPIRLAWYEAPLDPEEPWAEHIIATIVAPMSLDVSDMDGDGDLDVVAGEHNKAHPTQGRVFAFENTGAGFQQHLVAAGHEHHDGTQLVDIDNDGDLDIISIGWEHDNVLLYEHVGCPSQPDPPSTSTPMSTPEDMPTPTNTATPTDTPIATDTPTPTDSPIATDTPTPTNTPTATATTPRNAGAPVYYLSSTSGGTVGGIAFADEDIVQFDSTTGQWMLYFDGSDVGLAGNDMNAFHLRQDGSMLISLFKAQTLANLGTVDDSDILLFTPTSIGATTAGSFALYFDGSDVGLTTGGEKIDAVSETSSGGLLISTYSSAAVNGGVTATDRDVLLFSPTGLGANTAGSWSLFFQGSAIALTTTSEDIRGASLGAPNDLYLTTQGAFETGGTSGDASDVFLCRLAGTGANTGCSPASTIAWPGDPYGFGSEVIDALSVSGSGEDPPPPPTPTPTATPGGCSSGSIGTWAWNRHVIDPNKPGRAVFAFTVDINGDGRMDILTGKYWYRNPGQINGAWTRSLIGAPLEDAAAVYDFDGDGDLDVFGTTDPTLPAAQSRWAPFVWARNNGGVFTILNNIDNADLDMPTNDPIQGVVVDRFFPGGPLEIAVTWDNTESPSRNPHGVQMFTVPANPSAQTWERRKLSDVSDGEQLNTTDLDDDGDLDLFLGSKWLRNGHPASTWAPIAIFNAGSSQASRHELSDVDGDGDLDAFVGYSHEPDEARVMWYEQGNSPSNPWAGHLIANLPRGDAESMDVVDMDGDGDPDVIVGEYNHVGDQPRPGTLYIYENRGDGANWTRHQVYDGDSHYQASQAADIDGDGDLDIISKDWWTFRVHVYENRAADC